MHDQIPTLWPWLTPAVTLSWEDLASAALARQFPERPGSVAGMAELVGPMQTQTARSAFLGLAARFPGVTHGEVTAAYEAGQIVRGSTIRGTVHTVTPAQFAALGEATRVGQRRRWTQLLKLPDKLVDELWAATEEFARDWRTPDELRDHLVAWLADHHPDSLPQAETQPGRYLSFGHGGLVRRPASGAAWEGQGRPVYRAFDPPAPATLADVVRMHLVCHGPASRHDIAWWSGLGLGVVDSTVDELGLVGQEGPDGRTYLDLPELPEPRTVEGVRLLPEFDALLCGYDPQARTRFVDPAHHALLWSNANGLLLPPLLVDGRITGYWRAAGSARKRPLEVRWFPGTRRVRKAELERPVAALEAALGITVTEVSVGRA